MIERKFDEMFTGFDTMLASRRANDGHTNRRTSFHGKRRAVKIRVAWLPDGEKSLLIKRNNVRKSHFYTFIHSTTALRS